MIQSGTSGSPLTISSSFDCGCWGQTDCGATACNKPAAAATNGYSFFVSASNSASNVPEVKPPKPPRRDLDFLEGLSRRAQQRDRRRFKRF